MSSFLPGVAVVVCLFAVAPAYGNSPAAETTPSVHEPAINVRLRAALIRLLPVTASALAAPAAGPATLAAMYFWGVGFDAPIAVVLYLVMGLSAVSVVATMPTALLLTGLLTGDAMGPPGLVAVSLFAAGAVVPAMFAGLMIGSALNQQLPPSPGEDSFARGSAITAGTTLAGAAVGAFVAGAMTSTVFTLLEE